MIAFWLGTAIIVLWFMYDTGRLLVANSRRTREDLTGIPHGWTNAEESAYQTYCEQQHHGSK